MVLVDTSVWVSHLRSGEDHLRQLLDEGEVVIHPLIVGELACGRLGNRQEILSLLQSLPQSKTASQEEALTFIETHQLAGIGIGYIDVHLLAAARLSRTPLWTLDRRLRSAAGSLGVSYKSS